MTLLLSLYRGLATVGAPAVRSHVRRRAQLGREDVARLGERFGHPGLPRPSGALVWIHAASVGESASALPLIEALLARHCCSVLVTTGTRTSAELLEARLPPRALHQFMPVDVPVAVERFLDHWRPDLAVWLESELWPNTLGTLRRRGVECVLLNARMSDRSFRHWSLARGAASRLLGSFRIVLAQTEHHAIRLRALGAPLVRVVGNLKHAAGPLRADAAELAGLRQVTAGRAVWLAASTHSPEEALVARVHRALAPSHPGLLTLVVPRHPDRGDPIAAELGSRGISIARRSRGEIPGAATDLFLGDSMGELGLWYRLAPVAFVGRSLGARGGHNPLEPARLGCAVLFGPEMRNFSEIADELIEAGAARMVADERALAQAVSDLLRDAGERERLAAAAARVVAGHAGVLDAIMSELAPSLARLSSSAVARA